MYIVVKKSTPEPEEKIGILLDYDIIGDPGVYIIYWNEKVLEAIMQERRGLRPIGRDK